MQAMAEPKRVKAKGKAGRPKSANPLKPTISLKRSVEWRDWLKDLADHMHMPATLTIDQALILYAEAKGFKKPMPRR
jgi:hypothetical protein